MSFHRWGFYLGRLSVCWFDMWDRRPLLEIAWGSPPGTGRVLLGIGLHPARTELSSKTPDMAEGMGTGLGGDASLDGSSVRSDNAMTDKP